MAHSSTTTRGRQREMKFEGEGGDGLVTPKEKPQVASQDKAYPGILKGNKEDVRETPGDGTSRQTPKRQVAPGLLEPATTQSPRQKTLEDTGLYPRRDDRHK